MKLINNRLVHMVLTVSCEAVAWGEKTGLDLKTMLDVLAQTSGRNIAIDHFFPDYVLTGTYASGGSIYISRKDIGTFVDEAKAAGRRHAVAESAYEAIKELQEATPGFDQTQMLPFTRDGGTPSD